MDIIDLTATNNCQKHAIQATVALAFFALLDLFICAVLYKLTLSKEGSARLLIEKTTKKVYYVQDDIRHDSQQRRDSKQRRSSRTNTEELNSSEGMENSQFLLDLDNSLIRRTNF